MKDKCAVCESTIEVEESMCAKCYSDMPMDEWVSAERLRRTEVRGGELVRLHKALLQADEAVHLASKVRENAEWEFNREMDIQDHKRIVANAINSL